MAASFASASSQRLVNSTPLLSAVPLSVGLWVRPTTTGALRAFWALASTASNTDYFSLVQTSGNVWAWQQTDDASPLVTSAGTVTANQWAYIVGRAITTTNRRVAVFQYDGSRVHGVNTTLDTPASPNKMAIGCIDDLGAAQFFDGQIAEVWYTNTDIQPGGLQLDDGLLVQLALHGPLSVPHIRSGLIEYLPLRDSLLGDKGDYYSSRGRRTWTNTNGVTLA